MVIPDSMALFMSWQHNLEVQEPLPRTIRPRGLRARRGAPKRRQLRLRFPPPLSLHSAAGRRARRTRSTFYDRKKKRCKKSRAWFDCIADQSAVLRECVIENDGTRREARRMEENRRIYRLCLRTVWIGGDWRYIQSSEILHQSRPIQAGPVSSASQPPCTVTAQQAVDGPKVAAPRPRFGVQVVF